MRCVICNSTDKWKNVDDYRLKPAGMCMCTICGFISYPDKWKSKEAIVEYYRKEYRTAPSSNNFYTCQRKIHFHAAFLQSVFEEWAKGNKKNPEVFEIGAAFGTVLHWIRSAYPGANVDGTELTTSMRRVAWHEFGLALKEDINDEKKHDLIMSYKVAEHQLDVDVELKRYHKALNDDGYLYISVPTWFGPLTNFGAGGFDLEYYYDPNHINVWTTNNFEILLQKCGFEIVKADHIMYDSTYLCKKSNVETCAKNVKFDDPNVILENLNRAKSAFLAMVENDFKSAITIWPNFPVAHVNAAEMARKEIQNNGWAWAKENIIGPALEACNGAAEITLMAGDFALRLGQYQEAIDYANETLVTKPNTPGAYLCIINALREMAIKTTDPETKGKLFEDARSVSVILGNTSAQHQRESLDFRYLYGANIPAPFEQNAKPQS